MCCGAEAKTTQKVWRKKTGAQQDKPVTAFVWWWAGNPFTGEKAKEGVFCRFCSLKCSDLISKCSGRVSKYSDRASKRQGKVSKCYFLIPKGSGGVSKYPYLISKCLDAVSKGSDLISKYRSKVSKGYKIFDKKKTSEGEAFIDGLNIRFTVLVVGVLVLLCGLMFWRLWQSWTGLAGRVGLCRSWRLFCRCLLRCRRFR